MVCHHCGTRFRIADDLVYGRYIKFRCKGCGALLEAHLPRQERVASGEQGLVPPPLPQRQWFVELGERGVVGPLTLADLRLVVEQGEVGPENLVWKPGLGTWQPVALTEEIGQCRRAGPGALAEVIPLPVPRSVGRAPHGVGGMLALAPQPVEQAELMEAELPVPLEAQAVSLPRWPLWVAVLGAASLAAAVGLIPGRDRPVARDLSPVTPREEPSPLISRIPVERDRASYQVTTDMPPIEVRRARSRSRSRRGFSPVEHLPDIDPQHTLASQLEARPDDAQTILASRIYGRNKSSLVACDRLAERRGEDVQTVRAVFTFVVDSAGQVVVQVQARGASSRLATCYEGVASGWQIPVTGKAYTTQFWHVH